MSYTIYKAIKSIEAELEQKGDYWNDKVFDMERRCFNQIVEIRKFNRKTPYFDLKENWALLKAQKFDEVLENIKEWVMKTDERYDGETWAENFETRDAQKVRLIIERREARDERARQRMLRRG